VVAEWGSTEEAERYRVLAPLGLGGVNARAGPQDIHALIPHTYARCTQTLAERVAASVREHPEDGAFVIARDRTHQEEIVRLLANHHRIGGRKVVMLGRHSALNLTADNAKTVRPECLVVVTTLAHSTGYTLTRFRRCFSLVYPSNYATREQLAARINRIGQRAKSIVYTTVVDAGGFWDSVRLRHSSVKSLNDVLKHAVAHTIDPRSIAKHPTRVEPARRSKPSPRSLHTHRL